MVLLKKFVKELTGRTAYKFEDICRTGVCTRKFYLSDHSCGGLAEFGRE